MNVYHGYHNRYIKPATQSVTSLGAWLFQLRQPEGTCCRADAQMHPKEGPKTICKDVAISTCQSSHNAVWTDLPQNEDM